MRVEPRHAYVIAPNTDLAIQSSLFVVTPRQSEGSKPHLPVDFFLRSLAVERGKRAIGVVLSGSASDGTDGLRAIRAQDGITFAQAPSSAKFAGMPQSALEANVIDQCLDIPEIAAELVRLSRHPYVQLRGPDRGGSETDDGVPIRREHADLAKDDFLAILSHELRTPLSSMLLNAQRLRDGDLDRPALVRTGDALERAIRLQVMLIDDLLDISCIMAGKLSMDCRAVDLCELVRVTLEGMSPRLEAKQLALGLSLAAGLESIWADPERVQQVVTNLLTNAIKFTPRLGQVTVVVDAADGCVRLRVIDTGIGIEPGFLPHIFGRFSQEDTSITRKHGGLGLGLALVRALVALHGGRVQAQSPGAGRGATFSALFPVARVTDKVDAAASTPLAAAPEWSGRARHYDALADLRVLFIDDDFRMREAVLEVLQRAGARVALAASVADGLLALDTFKPQVIICDIAMPGEDGYAFIRKLRAREGGRDASIPTLALTALASIEDKRRALAAGFQAHLTKPIAIDRLRDAVLELAKLAAQPRA